MQHFVALGWLLLAIPGGAAGRERPPGDTGNTAGYDGTLRPLRGLARRPRRPARFTSPGGLRSTPEGPEERARDGPRAGALRA